MMIERNYTKQLLIICILSFVVFFSGFLKLSSEEITWIEVAKTDNEIQFIDPDSVKYNKKGFLSIITKSSEINQEDQTFVNTNSYLMVIDCENRLYNKLPINGEIKQVKDWQRPIKNKLIKETIINSCAY